MSFEGEIGEFDLIERMVELGRENFTGAIRFENDGIIKIVYFKGGDILSASTNDRSDSIDEILLRAGKVTREHVKQALSKRKEQETLGDALLGLGFITRKELTWARRAQAIGILRSLRGWAAGQYTIVADYLPKREEGTIFPLPQMLVELIVTEQDRGRFEKAMDGGSAVFSKASDFDDAFRRLGLNEDAAEIANHVDGFSSASEVANQSGKDAFNVYKLLEALRVLGLLQPVEVKPQPSSEVSLPPLDDFASAGVTDAADAWASPQFQLDDEPAVPVAPVMESWDEPAVMREELPPPSAPLSAPPPIAPASLPESIEPPERLQPAEPEWGFDEAQIETARRASVPVRGARSSEPIKPVSEMAPKERRATGAIVAAVVIVLLGVAGTFGYMWWQEQNKPAPVVAAPARPRPKLRPVVTASSDTTGTITPYPTTTSTTSTTQTTLTSAPLATTTAAAAAPIRVTATPAPTPAPVPPPQPQPQPVTAGSDAVRARYDAMARQHLATASSAAYTIQFELVCETASLTKAMAAGGDKLWFTPLSYRGRNCYRVFWGRYGSANEAKAAVSEIPASLRSGSVPVVVHSPQP